MAGNVAPNIVQDSLAFYVDAGNQKSYNSGSSTWFDMTSNAYTGSFINSPNFDYGNIGNIKFNGTTQYIDCRDFSWTVDDSFSIGVTFKINSSKTYHGLIGKPSPLWEWFLGVWNGNMLYVYYNPSGQITSAHNYGLSTQIGRWYNVCVTYNGVDKISKMYINGSLVSTTGIPADPAAAGDPTFINRNANMCLGNTYWGDNYLSGSISSAVIYNKELSSNEVLQNYNAHKSRFGLL